MKKTKIETPIYQQIAVDIATGIVNGKYLEGQRIYGRSTLSSQYNVSPETIRKAVYLLKDVGILDTERGSGIQVLSVQNAAQFIDHYREVSSVHTLKNDIVDWARRQQEETGFICEKIHSLVDLTDRLKNLNPFTPFELEIPPDSRQLGQTIAQLNFWHNTGATIIAVGSKGKTTLSPGPYYTVHPHDMLYIVGSDEAFGRAKRLLAPDIPHSGG